MLDLDGAVLRSRPQRPARADRGLPCGPSLPHRAGGVEESIRHSAATLILISLSRVDAAVVLGIVDDVTGFDAPPAGYPGLGQRLMEYRARVRGGRLSIEHACGTGTHIEVIIPVSASGPAAPL